MPPVIALLSDFGLQDHYVGAMKGAILAVAPGAGLVDLCHEVPPHDVAAGALMLDASYRYFAGQVLPLVRTYSDVEPGRACALVGSSGRLELAVNRGRAADALAGAPVGAGVRVALRR